MKSPNLGMHTQFFGFTSLSTAINLGDLYPAKTGRNRSLINRQRLFSDRIPPQSNRKNHLPTHGGSRLSAINETIDHRKPL